VLRAPFEFLYNLVQEKKSGEVIETHFTAIGTPDSLKSIDARFWIKAVDRPERNAGPRLARDGHASTRLSSLSIGSAERR
jgi:hypothetical protein